MCFVWSRFIWKNCSLSVPVVFFSPSRMERQMLHRRWVLLFLILMAKPMYFFTIFRDREVFVFLQKRSLLFTLALMRKPPLGSACPYCCTFAPTLPRASMVALDGRSAPRDPWMSSTPSATSASRMQSLERRSSYEYHFGISIQSKSIFAFISTYDRK